MARDAEQVEEVALARHQTAVAFTGHHGSSTSAKIVRSAGATLSPKSLVL